MAHFPDNFDLHITSRTQLCLSQFVRVTNPSDEIPRKRLKKRVKKAERHFSRVTWKSVCFETIPTDKDFDNSGFDPRLAVSLSLSCFVNTSIPEINSSSKKENSVF